MPLSPLPHSLTLPLLAPPHYPAYSHLPPPKVDDLALKQMALERVVRASNAPLPFPLPPCFLPSPLPPQGG